MNGILRRIKEIRDSRDLDGKIVFSAQRARSSSFLVRGIQMAEALGGVALRKKYLRAQPILRSRCLIWVAEPDLDIVARHRGQVLQILDVVQRWDCPIQEQFPNLSDFDGFLVNTPSMETEIREAAAGKPVRIIPHHHCNAEGYRLPQDRIEMPRVVGYVGAPDHLHDAERIERLVASKGLEFKMRGPHDLVHYRAIDLGIAWTRDEPKRSRFRSNVKHANFCAHGIPSVLPSYESYREADRELGGGTCLFAESAEEMLSQLERLIDDKELRREVSERAYAANGRYAIERIAGEYRAFLDALRPG